MKVALLVVCLGLAACASHSSQTSRRVEFRPWATEMPSGAYEHYIRGRLAVERGDHELAIVELRMASASAGGPVELRIAIVDEMLASGSLHDARAEAEDLTRDAPREAATWRLLGRARAALGDARGAAAVLERAAKLAPEDENAWLMLGAVRRQLGDDDGALDAYRALIEHLPQSAEGHFRLGRALAGAGNPDAARAELARTIELDPDHIDARVLLADVDRRAGRAGAAQATLRVAFDRSGSDVTVGERLFQVLLETGDQAAAAELLRRLDTDWRSTGIRLRIGLLFLQLRLPEDALRTARAVLARDPNEQSAQLVAARALAQNGRRPEAIALLREVPQLSHAYVEARAFGAELYGREGTPHEGLALLAPALTAPPATRRWSTRAPPSRTGLTSPIAPSPS